MGNAAEAIPYDTQARRYFGMDAEYERQENERELREAKAEVRQKIHFAIEEMGDGYAFEDAKAQEEMIDTIRDRAAYVVRLCDEWNDLDRYGI
jgi:alpha-amylase/alpha-mannosidase (GH57 family)